MSPTKIKKEDLIPDANSSLDMDNLGDRLLAMIAATTQMGSGSGKKNRSKSSSSSSSSSSESSDSSREKKKGKKKKKNEKQEKTKKTKETEQPKPSLPEKYVYQDSEEEAKQKRQLKKRNHDDEYDRKGRNRRGSSRDRRDSSSDRTRKSDRSDRRSRSRNRTSGHSKQSDNHHGSRAPPKAGHRGMEPPKEEPKPPVLDKNPAPKGKLYFPGKDEGDEDKEETIFEKKTSESAAKMKEVKKTISNFTISKSKLPFIGRMPILKKKVDLPKPEVMDEKLKVPEPVPPVVNKIYDTPPVEASSAPVVDTAKDEAEADIFPNNLPKSTLVISKRPPLSAEVVQKDVSKIAEDIVQEEDMDIDDEPQKETVVEENVQDIGVPSEVPLPPEKNELHKDFKDALDLLFPEQQREGEATKPEEAEVPVEQSGQAFSYEVPGYAAPPPQVPGYYEQYMQQGYVPVGPPPGFSAMPEFSQPPPGVPPVLPMQVPPLNVLEPPPQANIPLPPTDSNLKPNGAQEADPPKKKNPPGQRLRRFLKKKREEAEKNKKGETQVVNDPPPAPPPPKFRPEEMSELALLGIEESDITAQFF